MADDRDTLQADIEALGRILSQVRQTGETVSQNLATLQEQRAWRLASLAKRLPRDHPKAGVLQEEARAASRLQQELAATAKRQARRPRLKPGQRLIFGRVLDRKGLPIDGLRVRISDKGGEFDGIGRVETDEYGDFAIVTHAKAWPDPQEVPALHIVVENARGQRLLISRDTLGRKSDVAEYFLLIMGKRAAFS